MANRFASLWDPMVGQRGRLRRLQDRGMTECALRVVSGTQEGMRRRWTSGRVELEEGSLRFRPTLGGTVFSRPGQEWLSIAVLEVDLSRERHSSGRERWSVHPALHIVRLRTPNAELEWALRSEVRDWAIGRVNSPD